MRPITFGSGFYMPLHVIAAQLHKTGQHQITNALNGSCWNMLAFFNL